MAVRILHCGTSLENYHFCAEQGIAGFSNRGPSEGDIIYLAVRYEKKAQCGARMVLGEVTDARPWEDGEKYVHALRAEKVEFCEPFNLNIFSSIGEKHWGPKYLQGSKPMRDPAAIDLLQREFDSKRVDELVRLGVEDDELGETEEGAFQVEFSNERVKAELTAEIPEMELDIMGTFQIIPFKNETNEFQGLEPLVNKSFFNLFPFKESNSIIIPENRLFKTKGRKINGAKVQGIESIPDCLMISFKPKEKVPLGIYLIEYECFGENKVRESVRSAYLNSHIIPQLIRFSSAFSIITEEKLRESTIRLWADKIIDYIDANPELSRKMTAWIKRMHPDIKERAIDRQMDKELKRAFRTNVNVMLVIDDLSQEQKSTIKNVVNSFKLEDGEVNFQAYIVKLVQRINLIDESAEYALTVQ